jgi:hypothetical protein
VLRLSAYEWLVGLVARDSSRDGGEARSAGENDGGRAFSYVKALAGAIAVDR